MTIYEDVENRRRLDARLFTEWEHCFRQGISPLDLWDFEELEPINGWNYIGWCPAAATCIPNSNWGTDKRYPIAVLLEKDDVRVWIHSSINSRIVALAFRRHIV